jgi:predicted phage terminase large subunit-like protein
MHRDFFKLEKNPGRRGRREVTAAPRGNAKTTIKTTIKTIHAICYGYEKFIVILSNSGPEADEKVRDILIELETNKRLRQVFGQLAPIKGNRKTGRWGTTDFVTTNKIRVLAKSKGKQVRGLKHGHYRPTLIILDDVEAPEEVRTPEQRKKTRDWLFKDVMKAGGLGGKTNVIFVGTVLHQEGLLAELLKNPGWEPHFYRSVIRHADRQDLWNQWREAFCQLENPNRLKDARAFYEANKAEMLKGVEVLWPDGEPYYSLMAQRITDGEAAFNSEKQNEPLDPSRQLFNMAEAKRFKIVYNEYHQPKEIRWLDKSERVIPWDHIKEIVAFHDPAMGKKPTSNNEPDFTAIVVVAIDLSGYMYCLDAYVEKDPPSKQVVAAFALHQKWSISRLFLETQNFQELLKDKYIAEQKNFFGYPLRVVGVNQHEDKYARISTLEPEIAHGFLAFNIDLNRRLYEQLEQFPTGCDDGPDALEGAVRQLKAAKNKIVQSQKGLRR